MGHGGRRDRSEYEIILAEVFFDIETGRKRVRAIAGQPFPSSMFIECSKEIRQLPLGTIVRLSVVETEREGSRSFLYSSYKWSYDIIIPD